jgi:hypothetical protein
LIFFGGSAEPWLTSDVSPVVRNNRIAASQATQLVGDQLGVQGEALLDNHVPSSDNSQA